MPTTDATQTDTDGNTVRIEGPAAPFYAFTDLLDAVVEEARITVDDDGLHTAAVGPRNVGMVDDLHFPPEAFDHFVAPDNRYTVGISVDRLQNVLDFAHKGRGPDGGDPVMLTISPDHVSVEIWKEDGAMSLQEQWSPYDPETLRQRPNPPVLNDDYLTAKADPSTKTLRDGVNHLKRTLNYDHVWFTPDSDTQTDLLLQTDSGDDREATLRFPDTVYPGWSDDDRSLYSLSYLVDMADAVHLSRMDKVTVGWAAELPLRIHFQSEDWGATGKFWLAPRITTDD